MNRRSFFKQTLAAVVVAVASPTALVAPHLWENIKDWRDGYLTEEQAKRFIETLLNESMLADDARVVKHDLPIPVRFHGRV